MLTTATAMAELRRLAAQRGFDEARPSLAALWPAVREWVALPVDGAPDRLQDLLLFECSLDLNPPDRHSLGPAFIVGFTRQFSFYDDDGDYLGMQHVGVDLSYPVHDDFRAITRMADWSSTFGTADQFWGEGGERADEWADRVEGTRSYIVALRHTPMRVSPLDSPV